MNNSDLTPEIQEKRSVNLKLYSPIVIGLYCALMSIPVGSFLYGVNIKRRGQEILGTIIIAFSSLLYAGIIIAAYLDVDVFGIRTRLLSVVIGIGLAKVESAPFKKAISQGASKENWWLPLVVVIATLIIFFLIGYFTEPYEEF